MPSHGNDEYLNDLVKRAQKLLTQGESKELVVRRDTAPPVPPIEAPRLALPCHSLPAASGANAREPSIIEGAAIIELPRYCAIYDGELWLARYIWNGRSYEFITSIELTRQQQIRYAPENTIPLPAEFETDIERCACCGTWTPQDSSGSVQCHNGTPHYTCFGRTSLTGYFRCRASCGGYGQLYDGPAPKFGLAPGRGRKNSGTQF